MSTGSLDQRFIVARNRFDGQLVRAAQSDEEVSVEYRDLVRTVLRCPLPSCSHPELTFVRRSSGHNHFRHLVAVQHSTESIEHLNAKALLQDWVETQEGQTAALEYRLPTAAVADVAVIRDDQPQGFIEVQYSALPLETVARADGKGMNLGWVERNDNYANAERPVTWIFGSVGKQAPRFVSLTEGYRLNKLHRHLLSSGIIPLWIDAEAEEVLTPNLGPRIEAYKNVGLIRTPLSRCWIDEDGRFMTPTLKTILDGRERRAQRDRTEAERLQHERDKDQERARKEWSKRTHEAMHWLKQDNGINSYEALDIAPVSLLNSDLDVLALVNLTTTPEYAQQACPMCKRKTGDVTPVPMWRWMVNGSLKQVLMGIGPMCSTCARIHQPESEKDLSTKAAARHLAKVNGWNDEQVEVAIARGKERLANRSVFRWQVDVALLERLFGRVSDRVIDLGGREPLTPKELSANKKRRRAVKISDESDARRRRRGASEAPKSGSETPSSAPLALSDEQEAQIGAHPEIRTIIQGVSGTETD